MTKSIEVQVTGERVLAWAKRLAQTAANPASLLKAIGEDLTESTKQRFGTSTAPDGSKWAPNRASTLDALLGKQHRYKKGDRKGYLNTAGHKVVGSKKPLIGQTRHLSTEIHYAVNKGGSAWELIWGSPKEQAAMMQYGGKKSQFSHLWGDIPARPFLGLSAADMTNIETTTDEWLDGQASSSP
jgi:phage virion morphogenesis protein